MKRTTLLEVIAAATLALLAQAAPAGAIFRTWVSSTGDNANACTRALPCATFAGAIAKTDNNGEINCVDAGQYGVVTINKPVTIDCAGTLGAIGSGGSSSLISVNLDEATFPNGVVRLRNLTLNVGGVAEHAIVIGNGGGEVHVENCTITGVGAGKVGIIFLPAVDLDLFVRDSFIGGNLGLGLQIQPTVLGSARVSLNNVRLDHNGAGILVKKATGGTAVAILEDVRIENTTGIAVRSDGAGAFVFLSNSTVTLNGTAFSAFDSGKIFSFSNNTIGANAAVGSTPTALQQQ